MSRIGKTLTLEKDHVFGGYILHDLNALSMIHFSTEELRDLQHKINSTLQDAEVIENESG